MRFALVVDKFDGLRYSKLVLDAGSKYSVTKAFAAYRALFKGRIFMGLEIGIQGWGDALLTYDQVFSDLEFLVKDPKPGVFVWAYYSSAAAGLPRAKDCLKIAKQTKVPEAPL